MRARLSSLLLATACLAGVGCASKPAEEPSTASLDRACENPSGNSLHLTSGSSSEATARDAEIDSIVTQTTSDPRLERINRRMYLSLRSLDVELRREQRLAACAQPPLSNTTLEAQAGDHSGDAAAAGAGVAVGSADVTPSALAGAGTTRALRKASMSPNGGGGNGATAPKIVPGSDNDIVLRRLRRAAEQETDPTLRAKLWKEYTEYRLGTSSK